MILSLLFVSVLSHSALRVTIDPGHGGPDQGAFYANVKESDLALQISQKLYHLLSQDKTFATQLLRRSDEELTLEDRVEKTTKFKSDLFVSIHANANPNSKAHGTEFYIQNQLPMAEDSKFLAHNELSQSEVEPVKAKGDVESIIDDLNKSHRILKSYQVSTYLRKNWTDTKKKMIRQGPFFVLSQNKIPAILIEVGYMSNTRERERLMQPEEQTAIAKKIHQSLKDYAKNMDKLPPSNLQPQDAKTR